MYEKKCYPKTEPHPFLFFLRMKSPIPWQPKNRWIGKKTLGNTCILFKILYSCYIIPTFSYYKFSNITLITMSYLYPHSFLCLYTYHCFIGKKCPSKFNFFKDLRLFCDRRKERYLFIMIKNEQNEKHQTIWPWSQYWSFPQFRIRITAFCFIIIIVRYKTTNNERNGTSLNGRTVLSSYNLQQQGHSWNYDFFFG